MTPMATNVKTPPTEPRAVVSSVNELSAFPLVEKMRRGIGVIIDLRNEDLPGSVSDRMKLEDAVHRFLDDVIALKRDYGLRHAYSVAIGGAYRLRFSCETINQFKLKGADVLVDEDTDIVIAETANAHHINWKRPKRRKRATWGLGVTA